MGTEIKFEDIAARSSISIDELLKVEKGTISRTQRRVAEFEWMQLSRSALLNGPTDIALTFADYLGVANRKARSFDELLPDTKSFIDRIEKVSGARVTLISKEFSKDGVIDRDGWK